MRRAKRFTGSNCAAAAVAISQIFIGRRVNKVISVKRCVLFVFNANFFHAAASPAAKIDTTSAAGDFNNK